MGVMMPKRIQLRRTKGWRKPDRAVVVSRPSRWGNPFRAADRTGLDADTNRIEMVNLYRVNLLQGTLAVSVEDVRRELRGKDLACWCAIDGKPCHADVLLEIANA
jgi:uncharacterized protein DUF4326